VKVNTVFQKKHSTNLAIMELVERIPKAIGDKEYTMGVFLDLSKALDTVNHRGDTKTLTPVHGPPYRSGSWTTVRTTDSP